MCKNLGPLIFLGMLKKIRPYVYAVVGGIAILGIAMFIILYSKGVFEKKEDVRPVISEAPAPVDTVAVKDTMRVPLRIEAVEAMPVEPMPEVKEKVDSLIVETARVEEPIREFAEPSKQLVPESLYLSHVTARPLDTKGPIKVRITLGEYERVESRERVAILKPQPFWRKPLFVAAGAVALGAGAAAILLSGQEETEPATKIELPKPPGRP